MDSERVGERGGRRDICMVARGLHEGGVRLKGGVRGMWMGGEW